MVTSIINLAVLGSTGSIGTQTLDIVRAFPDRFRIIGLAAGNNLDLLSRQIAEFQPKLAHYRNQQSQHPLTTGDQELVSPEAMASHPQVDTVVVATAGTVGLRPVLAGLRSGKKVAIANKEPLVMAGEIITTEARQNSALLMPIDSEHSAIWQCLEGEQQAAASITLTASGGPFRNYTQHQLQEVTPDQALNHPSWRMGKKVTIDSATLMNKGLEVIEARWLFNMPYDRIRVLIHPQSIIHSLVEFVDGSTKAQLSCPDMRLPIQYALSYPQRLANPELPRLDWDTIHELTFNQPDTDTFPCLKLAIEAGKQAGTYPAVLAAADEIAVGLFLEGRIKFTDIARLVEQALSQHRATAHPDQEQILAADVWARENVLRMI